MKKKRKEGRFYFLNLIVPEGVVIVLGIPEDRGGTTRARGIDVSSILLFVITEWRIGRVRRGQRRLNVELSGNRVLPKLVGLNKPAASRVESKGFIIIFRGPVGLNKAAIEPVVE